MKNKLFNQYLGKTKEGEDCFFDLTKDLLVVDKNKQGQVTLYNKMINNLLKSKEDLQIALMDYENKNYKAFEDNEKMFPTIAHNKEEVDNMLNFLVMTLKARASLLVQCDVRNIREYNEKEINKLPYIFVIVDEISYLTQFKQIKELLSLSPLNRCCGIHLIVATSNLSLEQDKVLSGLVKATFLNRICFTVDTKEESKLVIDKSGAEELYKENNEIILSEATKYTKLFLDYNNSNAEKTINSYQKYSFFDIETSGLDADKNDIIKFYYVLTDNKMNIEKQEEFFINTGNTIISKEISTITGITQKDIDEGKDSEFLVDLLKDLINKETLMVSYNMPFTMSFLTIFLHKNEALEILTDVDYLDLLEVFKENEKGIKKYRIKNAVEFYKLNIEPDGTNDLAIYYELFKKMNERYKLNDFIK